MRRDGFDLGERRLERAGRRERRNLVGVQGDPGEQAGVRVGQDRSRRIAGRSQPICTTRSTPTAAASRSIAARSGGGLAVAAHVEMAVVVDDGQRQRVGRFRTAVGPGAGGDARVRRGPVGTRRTGPVGTRRTGPVGTRLHTGTGTGTGTRPSGPACARRRTTGRPVGPPTRRHGAVPSPSSPVAPRSRSTSSSTTLGSSLVKTGVGLAIGAPGATGSTRPGVEAGVVAGDDRVAVHLAVREPLDRVREVHDLLDPRHRRQAPVATEHPVHRVRGVRQERAQHEVQVAHALGQHVQDRAEPLALVLALELERLGARRRTR